MIPAVRHHRRLDHRLDGGHIVQELARAIGAPARVAFAWIAVLENDVADVHATEAVLGAVGHADDAAVVVSKDRLEGEWWIESQER